MGKLYDLRAKVGEYEKAGETKSRYMTIGAVLETKNGGKMIKIDSIPTNWDGFAYLNEPYEKKDDRPMNQAQALNGGKDVVLEDIDDKPIDLGSIPF